MKRLMGILMILVGLCMGFFVIPTAIGGAEWNRTISNVKSGDEEALTEKVMDIAELSVLDYKYSNATSITDQVTIDEFNVPFTKKAIVMTYSGDIKIGADAEKITVAVVKGSGDAVEEVKVGLPPMKITSNDIDRDSIKYPLEKNSILNKITSEDYAKMEEDGKTEMAEAVNKSGAMGRAKEELKTTIKGYLEAMYGDEVKVTFTDIKA